MRDITHAELVKRTFKSGEEIIKELGVDHTCDNLDAVAKIELLHATFGIVGEAGELADAVKKYVFYNQELNIENVIEELGDLKYYIEAVVQNLQQRDVIINQEEIEDANIDKLRKRYDKLTFSNEAAKERADKVEEVS